MKINFFYLLIFLLVIFIFFKFKKNKYNFIKKIFFPDKIEIFIQNILYIFLLGGIFKKKITVYILLNNSEISLNLRNFCEIQASCCKKNIQFFLQNSFSNMIFFINSRGSIVSIAGFTESFYEEEITLKDKVKINYDLNTSFFDITIENISFEKNTFKKTVLVLSEILCNQNCD